MRILVVGAGAIGGYFGGRLAAAGRDVVFLVREGRAQQLAAHGLSIRSPLGDAHVAAPRTITAAALSEHADLVLLSCKAYDLGAALDDLAPAVGPGTAIVPLLNGMRHLDELDARFGAARVLGGLCLISSALDEGKIVHLNTLHTLTFGERDGSRSARVQAIAAVFEGALFDAQASDAILAEMWAKWVFIVTGAGITSLMRANVGDIVTGGGAPVAVALLDEAAAIAAAEGFPPSSAMLERSRTTFTAPGSPLTASMYRDIARGAPTEAEHVVGDLLRRGDARGVDTPVLRIVAAHLRTYEAQRSASA